ARTRWRRVAASLCSSSASASQGRGTSGRPCCRRLIRRRSRSSMGAYRVDLRREAPAALLVGAGAEQQLVRSLVQAELGEQGGDVLDHALALAAVHHAEQVV